MAAGRMLFLKKADMWEDYSSYSASKKQVMGSPLLSRGYASLIIFDYYVVTWFKLLFHVFSKEYLIVDRYIYDTVITDLAAYLGYSIQRALGAIELGIRFLPQPDYTILIDLPEEVAFARKDDMPHVDYLRERRHYYLALQSRPEVSLLSGTNSPEELLQDSMAIIAPSKK